MKKIVKLLVQLLKIFFKLDSQKLIIDRFVNTANATETREIIDGYAKYNEMSEILNGLKNKVFQVSEQYTQDGDLIVDFGCGSGRYLEMFEKRSLVGVDSNNIVLERITTNKIPDAKLYCIDLTNKKQMDNFVQEYRNSIDFLYTTIVLQHIPRSKIKKLFRNIELLLKKQGVITLAFPTSLDFYERYGESYYIRYSDVEIRKILLKNNFIIRSLEVTNNGQDAFIVAIKQ
jgi:SAM-dependent methyltransferase